MSKAMFGFFNGSYYTVNDDASYVVIPENADYKSSAITSQIRGEVNECDVDLYAYNSMLISECNAERVAYMKEFLMGEKIKHIGTVNDDYVINVQYELFNKENKVIKSGETSIKAKYFKAMVQQDIAPNNSLEYRQGFVFDGRLEVQIPEISNYGIKHRYDNHPYTLRIRKISVLTTTGDTRFIKEANTQVDINHKHFETHCHWRCHRPDDLHFNNYASHFLTNARIGTTVIDQTVVPTFLDTASDYEVVKLCETELLGNEYTVRINHKLQLIVINVELFCDNYNVVYDVNDIARIIELNNREQEEDDDYNHDPFITGEVITIGENCDSLEEAIAGAHDGDMINGKGMMLTEPLVIDKAINISNFIFDYGASLKVNCEGDIEIIDCVFNNNIKYGKTGSVRNPLIVNCEGKVKISGNVFKGDNVFYNAIETGQLTCLKDGSEISNNRFEGALANNAINIFKYDAGAKIYITDNIFIAPSNAVRISDYDNVTATFIIDRNNYNDSVASEEYQGFMLFQAVKNEDFSNLTVYVTDLYYKGTKLTESAPSGVKRVWYTYNTDTVPNVIIQ